MKAGNYRSRGVAECNEQNNGCQKIFPVIFLGIELISRMEATSRAVRCGIQK
jgi:hypothetical protein